MFGETEIHLSQVTIRPCTDDDIESIVQLDRLWDEEGVAYVFVYSSKDEFLSDFERFREYYWVAESEGEIIGYINGSVRVNENQKVAILPNQEPYLEIENIFVRAEYRDQHIGGALIEKLLDVARSNGIKRFFVATVTKDMARILRFYQTYGFAPWYVELFKEIVTAQA